MRNPLVEISHLPLAAGLITSLRCMYANFDSCLKMYCKCWISQGKCPLCYAPYYRGQIHVGECKIPINYGI